jgi:predicted ATPase
MIHLRSFSIKPSAKKLSYFPFNIPVVKTINQIEFNKPVTFFVGENGTGKSTLLEAIAAGVGSIAIGGADIQRDETMVHARKLAEHMSFTWRIRTRRGFFFRAEDFFNFARRMSNTVKELDELEAEFDEELQGYGRLLATNMAKRQRHAIRNEYGGEVDARSHGESFLNVFQARFTPGGLYILDEPEAPLSPQRQLSFLVLLKEMVNQDAQFLIATHSPILMAFPGASILCLDHSPAKEVAFDELEHVTLTRDILNNPKAFLHHLLRD